MGLEAVRSVAGIDAERIRVRVGEDSSGEPSIFFLIVMDQDKAAVGSGLLRIRIGQRLRDMLLERHDERYPFVQFLSRSDWDRASVA